MNINDLKMKSVGFVSLGCDKNRVDLERIIFSISNFGFKIENDPKKANIIIINTCSFLESSRLESINSILEMSDFRTSGNLEKIIVTGCLNELKYTDLKESLPEVDAFVRVQDNDKIISIIGDLYGVSLSYNSTIDRVLSTASHYAYLKISEGCNNFCSYCLIPYIRGRYVSTPMEDLIAEAKNLAKKGVKELIIVAQDITKYGIDIYKKVMLVPLLQKLSKINGIEWIRLLYAYPEGITDELIEEIKTNKKIVKYLDIPLQHVSDDILKKMNRKSDFKSICSLFEKLKSEIPNIVLRSTFILGFPGEVDKNVAELEDFLKKFKLNNVGFFKYSREEGTRAYDFENQVDERTKDARLDRMYTLQYSIVLENNASLVGKEFSVIVDDVVDGKSICRYYGESPIIDTVVYVNQELDVGKFYKVKIKSVLDYDLEGELV